MIYINPITKWNIATIRLAIDYFKSINADSFIINQKQVWVLPLEY
jgi:hypothetical protein